jgi:hypothetical protein
MDKTKLKVETESDSFGIELEEESINLDLFLQPEEDHKSLINFYEDSLVGKKKQLKKNILKELGTDKVKELEAKLHSNREPLSKPIGTVTVNKNLDIVDENFKI